MYTAEIFVCSEIYTTHINKLWAECYGSDRLEGKGIRLFRLSVRSEK